jgi:hypothetical protein
VGLKISEVSWVYILTIFIVVYATSQLGLPRPLLLNAIFIAALVEVVTIPVVTMTTGGSLVPISQEQRKGKRGGKQRPKEIEDASPDVVGKPAEPVVVALSFGHGTMFGLQSA